MPDVERAWRISLIEAVISFCDFLEQYLQAQLLGFMVGSRMSQMACGMNSLMERNLCLEPYRRKSLNSHKRYELDETHHRGRYRA